MGIIYVPDDHGDIQTAINNAIAADEIVVRDGTWTGANNKNLDPGGKQLTIRSEGGSANCIIDCQGSGRGLYYHNGEGLDSVFDGFTIQNGVKGVFDKGGGIGIAGAYPTLKNLVVKDNLAGYGGGIGVVGTTSGARLINCLVINNATNFAEGGGIYNSQADIEASLCTIRGNSAGTKKGGGYYQSGTSASGVFTDSTFWENTASSGYQVYIYQGPFTFNYCNHANGASDVAGTVTHNFCQHDQDPLFVAGPAGNHYLSQIAAGQGADSPCVDAGSDTAAALGMDTKTTRTDEVTDAGQVDIGWHYESAGAPPGPSPSMLGQTTTG